MNKRLMLSTIALTGYMAIIFYLSNLPGDLPTEIEALKLPRTVMHVGEYGILGFLMNIVVVQLSGKTSRSLVLSSAFSSVYGVTDEIHQSFVPTRCFDVYDICADTIGAIAGAVFLVALLSAVRMLRYKK